MRELRELVKCCVDSGCFRFGAKSRRPFRPFVKCLQGASLPISLVNSVGPRMWADAASCRAIRGRWRMNVKRASDRQPLFALLTTVLPAVTLWLAGRETAYAELVTPLIAAQPLNVPQAV